MSKFILIGLSLVSMLFFIGCSSTIQISKEDSEWIKEYIDYSNTYIESSFKIIHQMHNVELSNHIDLVLELLKK